MGIIRNPFLRNPFESYDWMAGRNRNEFLTGKLEDPVASNQQRMLSQAGVYEPSDGLNAGPPERSTPSWDMASWLDDLRDVYTKEGPAAKTYREHLGSMPQYQTPTKWGKFGAALVGAAEGLHRGGAAGWRAGQEAAQAPYRRELEQWGIKEQALGRDVEAEDKAANRKLAYMNAVRQVAKDESEYRRHMQDYELRRSTEMFNQEQDLATRRRWDRQDRKEYTNAQGQVVSYIPGVEGSEIIMSGGTLAGAQFGETKRRNRETEATARRNAATAEGQLGVSRGNLALAQQREGRIANEAMDPRAQSAAMESAISRALSEDTTDTWRDEFYDVDSGTLIPPDADDPEAQEEYRRFKAKVDQHYNTIMSTTRSPRVVVYE